MEENGMLSYVKQIIHALVISTPQRMSVEGLKRDYLSTEGSPLPYDKLGFKNVESFLHSISDTVLLVGCGPMAEVVAIKRAKSAHIQNLVKSQKKPSVNARNRNRQKSRFMYPSERSDLVFVNEQQNSNRRFNNYNNNYNYRAPLQSAGNRLPPRSNYNNYNGHCDMTHQEQRAAGFSQPRKTISSIASSFAKLKIVNVDDDSSSDDFQMYLPDRDQNKVQSNSPVHLDNNANVTAKKPTVDTPLVYASSGDGRDEDAIPASAVDKRVLNYKSTKNTECINLVIEKPQVKQPTMEPFYVYQSSDEGSDSEAIPADAVDDRVIGVSYPNDAVRLNHPLPGRDIYKKMRLDSRIQVQLVTVASPLSFYFWIHDEDYDEYKAMSNNMQNYYDNINEQRYTIPMFLIMAGHLAAYRDILWQRVRVLDIKTGSNKDIEVEFIDTGERKWVCRNELKYLAKEFATLPAQCWHGRLACIVPRQGAHFSADASNYFYQLVSYRRLYAKIEKINETNNSVHMILVDPDAEACTKNINIALIESGLVRRCYSP
ncbi:hypothetical protein ACLKA6_017996 [Drosophila palustris]